MPAVKPATLGRPSKYKPVYDDLVIEEMASGKSITAFAAEIGVARATVYKWADEHQSFSDALNIAKAKCQSWWESQARLVATKGGEPGRATMIIFGLKNMGADDWRERQSVEHTGKDGGPIKTETVTLDPAKLSSATLAELLNAATDEG